MGKTIGKPLGAYRRPIVCGLISLAKLPANLSVRPPACFPDWKILGKVDGQHAGKLDIPITKPRGNLSETSWKPLGTSRRPLGNLLETSRNLLETSRNLSETSRRPLGNLSEPLGDLSETSRRPLGNLSEPLGNLKV